MRLRNAGLALALASLLSAAETVPDAAVNVGVNRSVVLENTAGVKRISVANPELAEVIAISRHEIVVNGKAPGQTSMLMWDVNGQRTSYDVHVSTIASKTEMVAAELGKELPGQNVSVDVSDGSVFLRGTVDDLVAADRAVSIASTLGKVVNLLRVKLPPSDPQIVLRVKFANVDRAAVQQLGMNLFSTGATNTIGGISTGQFGGQPTFTQQKDSSGKNTLNTTFNSLLNVFLFRNDLNLGAAIQALQAKQLAEILAEPNLLTVSGRPASFLAGGEFPFPTLQGGGAGVGQVTIQFREFGIRLKFLPVVTPRGSIRLVVTPEVSALDYANGLTISGATVPGLSTRRVQTEVELQSGQSFVIAGLIDNRTTEILNKIPGLSNIPLLGKIFESRSLQKNNSELMVLVTPELVDPLKAGTQLPDVTMPKSFLKDGATQAPKQPASPNQKLPELPDLPQEVMRAWMQPAQQPQGNGNPMTTPNGMQPLGPPTDNNSTEPATSAKAKQP